MSLIWIVYGPLPRQRHPELLVNAALEGEDVLSCKDGVPVRLVPVRYGRAARVWVGRAE